MYMYMCTCTCIYVFMYLCIYVYMYICIYVYMYTCIYVYMYICIYVHMYIYIYVYMYICIYIYVYMYICTYIYVYMYICIYVYMYMCKPVMHGILWDIQLHMAYILQLRFVGHPAERGCWDGRSQGDNSQFAGPTSNLWVCLKMGTPESIASSSYSPFQWPYWSLRCTPCAEIPTCFYAIHMCIFFTLPGVIWCDPPLSGPEISDGSRYLCDA